MKKSSASIYTCGSEQGPSLLFCRVAWQSPTHRGNLFCCATPKPILWASEQFWRGHEKGPGGMGFAGASVGITHRRGAPAGAQ